MLTYLNKASNKINTYKTSSCACVTSFKICDNGKKYNMTRY